MSGSAPIVTDQPGALPLFILAGLPKSNANRVADALNRRSNEAGDLRLSRFIVADFDDSLRYLKQHGQPTNAVIELFDKATEFVIDAALRGQRAREKTRRTHAFPAPTRIFLLYLRAADDQGLLDQFAFFACPIPIDLPDGTSRGDAVMMERCLADRVRRIHQGQFQVQDLRTAISEQKAPTPLTLPPLNFQINGQPINVLFREAFRSSEACAGLRGLSLVRVYTKEQLPQKVRGKREGYLTDSRGIVFPEDGHGLTRFVGEMSSEPHQREVIRRTLNGLYRFGMPMTSGLHFDAQRPYAAPLQPGLFTCVERGVIDQQSTYLNVYPNDVIRVP